MGHEHIVQKFTQISSTKLVISFFANWTKYFKLHLNTFKKGGRLKHDLKMGNYGTHFPKMYETW